MNEAPFSHLDKYTTELLKEERKKLSKWSEKLKDKWIYLIKKRKELEKDYEEYDELNNSELDTINNSDSHWLWKILKWILIIIAIISVLATVIIATHNYKN